MTTAPEPGSPADLDEQRREEQYRLDQAKMREMDERDYKKRNRDDRLTVMASVIAGGLIHRVSSPVEVAAQSVDVALHILKRVEELP